MNRDELNFIENIAIRFSMTCLLRLVPLSGADRSVHFHLSIFPDFFDEIRKDGRVKTNLTYEDRIHNKCALHNHKNIIIYVLSKQQYIIVDNLPTKPIIAYLAL
jgi:hypothetical protein